MFTLAQETYPSMRRERESTSGLLEHEAVGLSTHTVLTPIGTLSTWRADSFVLKIEADLTGVRALKDKAAAKTRGSLLHLRPNLFCYYSRRRPTPVLQRQRECDAP